MREKFHELYINILKNIMKIVSIIRAKGKKHVHCTRATAKKLLG